MCVLPTPGCSVQECHQSRASNIILSTSQMCRMHPGDYTRSLSNATCSSLKPPGMREGSSEKSSIVPKSLFLNSPVLHILLLHYGPVRLLSGGVVYLEHFWLLCKLGNTSSPSFFRRTYINIPNPALKTFGVA